MPLTYGWKILVKQWFINKTIRSKHYDYNSPGAYFVTICERDKKCIFGDVAGEKMILNEFGSIAEECLMEIPKHFENTEAPEFVVMPNHVHAIIMIYDDFFKEKKENVFVGQTHAFDTDFVNKKAVKGMPLTYG